VAVNRWAREFEERRGRKPVIWLDKACIDQQRIDESLKCLPIFLAGCTTLLVLVGPEYPTRLWCLIEAFTFLRMGADPERIRILPLTAEDANEEEITAAEQDVRLWFEKFDIRKAQCYAADRDRLLGAIETGFDTLDEFNVACSGAMVTANTREILRRKSSVTVASTVGTATNVNKFASKLKAKAEQKKVEDEKPAVGADGDKRKSTRKSMTSEVNSMFKFNSDVGSELYA